MEDLRSVIRAAFEKEQAAHPPEVSLRQTVVRAVAMQPRRETNLQWVAVAVAALLGILIVGALMSTKLTQRANVPVRPQATPSAAPVNLDRDYGPPPAGVPLFYVESPTHPGWYIGFDWNGVPGGTIKLVAPIESRLTQSPDGSSFAYAPNGKGGYDQFLDRLGQPSGGDSPHTYQDQMWAAESGRLCTLDYNSGQWRIGVRAPGAAPTSVHAVAIDPSAVPSSILAIGFRSCSPLHDRAVLVYNYLGRPTHVWVVRISDGAILFHQSHAASTLADIVASQDGVLIAESSNQSTGFIAGATAPQTTIRGVSANTPVLILDPSYGVLGFSSDNSLVLVTTRPWASGIKTHLAAIDLATGKVVWRYDGDEELAGFFTDPTGAAFALMLQNPSEQSLHPGVFVTMVYINGVTQGPPGRFVRP
jgi:hypothetical protein